MQDVARSAGADTRSAGHESFVPKLVTVLRDGYGASDLRKDAQVGLTVAIVALPLSMAIAIASGVGPERGLFTAIVGGFLVSALGGSRFQIGGPAGAFIVLVSACVMEIGVDGLILATFLSGIVLALMGVLRLGSYVRYIPYPVTVGFTAGIAVIILASQFKDLFGLTMPGSEPSEFIAKLGVLWGARASLTPSAIMVSLGTIVAIEAMRRANPAWPRLLIAITLASLAVYVLDLPVETIGSRFGELPATLPAPGLPTVSLASVTAALPFAASFALLGAIESLLSAVVADGMSGAAHRSNVELVAQGVANMGAALFGGFCVTGTIARTATNVRAGSRGPVSGMLHSVFILAFMFVAAPAASHIPLAALAGVLAVVAWNMVEKDAFWALLRSSWGDALVLVTTFLLVIFRDLTEGIVIGFILGALLFIRRMTEAVQLRPHDDGPAPAGPTFASDDTGIVVYRLEGAFFFGAVGSLGAALEQIAQAPRAFVLDISSVPFIDASGARSIELLAHRLQRRGGKLYVAGASRAVRRSLMVYGVRRPMVSFRATVASAVAAAGAGPVGVAG